MAPSLAGKICLITGGSTGIGKVTAVALARMGAQVTFVSRDPGRAQAALAEIREKSGRTDVELILADLSSMKEVRRVAAEFRTKHDRLDILLNNAGVIITHREITEDGYEKTFAINHLAHFLLTDLLLDLVKKSAPARVVNVSSGAHRRGHMDFHDLMGEKRYRELPAYCQSKLANILFTFELDRRLAGSGITVNAMHPGGVATRWGMNTSGLFRIGLGLARPFLLTEEEGAQTAIYLCSSPEVEKVSGRYFYKCKPAPVIAEARHLDVAKELWTVSERLTQEKAKPVPPPEAAHPPETAKPPETAFPPESALPAETALPPETAIPPEKALPADTAHPPETAIPPEAAEPADSVVPPETIVPG